MHFIESQDELPVPGTHSAQQDQQRKRTDNCCTICAVLFSVSLFAYAIYSLNIEHLMRSNFPVDSNGRLCGYEKPQYPYLYVLDVNDIKTRVCIQKCPGAQQPRLNCSSEDSKLCSQYVGSFYQTITRLRNESVKLAFSGQYCVPKDMKLREAMLSISGLNKRQAFIDLLPIFLWSAVLALSLSLVYVLLLQLLPNFMNNGAVTLCGVVLIASGIILILKLETNQHAIRNITATVSILLGLYLLPAFQLKKSQLRINAIFLKQATTMLGQHCGMLLYIPLFYLLFAGLLVLTLFELFSFWSIPAPQFQSDKAFNTAVHGKGYLFLMALVGVQLYWGFWFLATLMNFCVSGNAVAWYFGRLAHEGTSAPFCRVLKYHFGSVVGSSLILGLFDLLDFCIDIIKPKNKYELYGTFYAGCCGWLDSLLTLVRTDAMAYTNLSGLAFCNSARYCDFLCNGTKLFSGSQSPNRLHRFSGRALMVGIVASTVTLLRPQIGLLNLLIVSLLAIALCEFFIGFHANLTEGLTISFLAEQYLEMGSYNNVKRAPPGLLYDVRNVMVN